MKKFKFGSLILTVLFLGFSFAGVRAQQPPQPPPQEVGLDQPPPARANLLRELNLSPEQVREIRRLNQETRPLVQEAQRRLREANFALDQAIYADAENEPEVQARLRDVHAAQMEVLRNRTRIELAIRRVLSPEQLVKFRALRGDFAAGRRNNPRGDLRMNPRRRQRQDSLRNLPKALRPGDPKNRRPPRPVQ